VANKFLLATALLVAAGNALAAEIAPRASVVEADPQVTQAPLTPEADGFIDPLRELKFNPGLDQREFERSTLEALNVYDPLESVNRRIYHFNYRLDQWVLLPLVNGYQYVTPSFVRTGVSNFFNNLGDIPNLFNSVLQLKAKRSAEITARLMFNTIIGVGGLWDPATSMGLPRQSEDFGQTLGFYGVPDAAGARPVKPARHDRTGGGLCRRAGGQLPERGRSQRASPGDLCLARGGQALHHQIPLWAAQLAVRV